MLTLPCPACGHRGQVPEAYAGKTVTCPKCEEKIRVPTPAAQVPTGEPSGGMRVLIIAGVLLTLIAVLVGLFFRPAEPTATRVASNQPAAPRPESPAAAETRPGAAPPLAPDSSGTKSAPLQTRAAAAAAAPEPPQPGGSGVGQEEPKNAIVYKVTVDEIAAEFSRDAQAATRKYDPNPLPTPRGHGGVVIEIHGEVVASGKGRFTLKTSGDVKVVVLAQKIDGPSQQRSRLDGLGKFVDFQTNTVTIACDQVTLQPIPGN